MWSRGGGFLYQENVCGYGLISVFLVLSVLSGCLGECGILWDISVPCCCVLALCTNAAGGSYKFTRALCCRVFHCTACAGAITTRFTVSHTACFW